MTMKVHVSTAKQDVVHTLQSVDHIPFFHKLLWSLRENIPVAHFNETLDEFLYWRSHFDPIHPEDLCNRNVSVRHLKTETTRMKNIKKKKLHHQIQTKVDCMKKNGDMRNENVLFQLVGEQLSKKHEKFSKVSI